MGGATGEVAEDLSSRVEDAEVLGEEDAGLVGSVVTHAVAARPEGKTNRLHQRDDGELVLRCDLRHSVLLGDWGMSDEAAELSLQRTHTRQMVPGPSTLRRDVRQHETRL